MKKLLLPLALLLGVTAQAEVKLQPLFSDNMILQQQTLAPIWGKSTKKDATVSVTTSWDNKTTKTKVDKDGKWRVELETPAYGAPYTITIDDGDKSPIKLENVAIGEVWVASGQSNMEMEMAGFNCQYVENSNRDIALSKDRNLRIMSVNRTVMTQPSDSVNSAGWSEACSEIVTDMSAAAYYFARTMRTAMVDVPVGILEASWGGTSINSWVTPADAATYEDVKSQTRKHSPRSQHYFGGLYNGMIHPIAGYSAKGILWYQGEADRMRYETYTKKMSDLITAWRKSWGKSDVDMPFYYVQIAPYEYSRGRDGAADTLAPYMREVQAKAADVLPNTGVVILSDAGMQTCIHPSNKLAVGERLAYQALVKTYGFGGFAADPPIYKSAETKDGTLILTFDNAEKGLTSFGKRLSDFEIAGEDGVFVAAGARIRGNTVILSAKGVENPVKARYGFKNWFEGSLFGITGLPVSTFKTY